MARLKTIYFFSIFLFTGFFSVTKSQNWPYWRGPNQDGISIESNLPIKWDSVTNIVWKTKVPGIGYSSPIIWEEKLFTFTALPETQERVLLCYDSNSGKLLWQETVLTAPLEDKHKDNSYASGTPATDGSMVYISFLDGKDVVVAAYDFSGNRVWIQRPGTFWSEWGYSCSPRIFNDKVIINGNSRGEAPFIAAMSKTDGKILWKVDHEKPANNFSTPIIKNMSGKNQMIFCGNQEISSYNPDNGEQNWFVDGPSKDFCSSPVYNKKNDLVIVSSAWPRRILVAIKPNGQGNVTESNVLWSSTEGAVYVPSLITFDDYLFSTMTNGYVHCIDVTSGKVLWKEDLGPQYSSPVWAGGLLYMPNDEGVITVIKPGPEFEIIAENSIGEKMFASPAISNGKIFLRGVHHLFCIGN